MTAAASGFWPQHSRRTSDMERVQASESDLFRRSSLPSRLRASSTSHQSLDSSPTIISPPSSVSSPQSPSREVSVSKVQALLADENRCVAYLLTFRVVAH